MEYCNKKFQTSRRKTSICKIGNVEVGGDNPIRIQSMTTSKTSDVEETIEQIIKLADYGCEIARVTVQGKKEALACEHIKNGLLKRGYDIPLVADIHFYPPAAILVAEFVDKVRVNPGNYVDKRATFKTIEYTDQTYQDETDRIHEKFSPLVLKCKGRNISMRIGTNHGSLSDRIMNRYGDTPMGMVESALEFARVCRSHDYHNFIFSMKASNPVVMVLAYRLLVTEMERLGWEYPLHLGVTEAGSAEDGRVKSAVGIGSLLLDGLGDTIRVSLTEDPWYEIDPCKRLVSLFETYEKKAGCEVFDETTRDISQILKREVETKEPLHPDGTVVIAASEEEYLTPRFMEDIGCEVQLGQPTKIVKTADIVLVSSISEAMGKRVERLMKAGVETIAFDNLGSIAHITSVSKESWEAAIDESTPYILLELKDSRMHEGRRFFQWLKTKGYKTPVILLFDYTLEEEDVVIWAATEFGSLLGDALGDGVCMLTGQSVGFRRSLSFSILQAARLRNSKTEFIACPSCGRTLFDLQTVTEGIKERTGHLPGVKIAIMGCIVNGPGEMADADFGYVGSRTNMIDLYVSKTRVEKNIPEEDAVKKLIELIKLHGRWVEPKVEEPALV